MKKRFLSLKDESSKWWQNSKEEKIVWYVKRGEDYWILPGSEFPEKKIDAKTKKIKKVKHKDSELKFLLLIMLASFLGVALAVLIFSIML
tara:strand:+ start:903 stop:1172 length:270 start_codon:yes stop_codon:yes gene_type:complete